MGSLRLVIAAALLSSTAFGLCGAKQKKVLNADTAAACQKVRRALYVMEKFPERIEPYFGRSGANFSVYLKNPGFYKARLRRRVKACDQGPIPLSCAGSWGRCATDRETVAYVLITFGVVHDTINVCNTYFSDPDWERANTLTHEFGRLENIGDSQNFDTNNIYVWDRIVDGLSDPTNYSVLTAPKTF
jgi:hypothetical protein